jgi:hypothetical protein
VAFLNATAKLRAQMDADLDGLDTSFKVRLLFATPRPVKDAGKQKSLLELGKVLRFHAFVLLLTVLEPS